MVCELQKEGEFYLFDLENNLCKYKEPTKYEYSKETSRGGFDVSSAAAAGRYRSRNKSSPTRLQTGSPRARSPSGRATTQ